MRTAVKVFVGYDKLYADIPITNASKKCYACVVLVIPCGGMGISGAT
jgi:hypothetical protein